MMIDGRTTYEAIAAGQTTQVIGDAGAKGNVLQRLVIIPANTSPGAVTIKDGANTAITIFPGGANSVLDLKPIVVELGIKSTNNYWQVTTGAGVSAIAVGCFEGHT